MAVSRAEIVRDIQDDRATLGRIFFYDEDGNVARRFYTLENPWLDNEQDVSCIPLGEYVCRRVDSPKYGDTFEITGVDGRTHILFHEGNWPSDTLGCVLLGLGRAPEVPAVWSSKAARAEFMEATEGVDEFPLSIYQEAA